MKFAKLLCPLLANTEAFGDTDKSSIGIPKIGEDLTVSCEGMFYEPGIYEPVLRPSIRPVLGPVLGLVFTQIQTRPKSIVLTPSWNQSKI